ncbi:MAG: serine/threonine-protein kinase [Deltaproteobacteria bacterium]|nr:serine/threonine-protein kinase [Deltaproteobacteria bacterium]
MARRGSGKDRRAGRIRRNRPDPRCYREIVDPTGEGETASRDEPTSATVAHGRRKRGSLGPGDHVGRYLVQGTLGMGGMGVVYRARDPELGRAVAIKLVRAGSTADTMAQERLLREAQALARLAHPNVVGVHDVGTYGAGVFIAMELVEGDSLKAWVAAAPRPWRAIVAVLLEAGRGLAAAHAAGIVHRDFKPHNVIVGHDQRVRVLDFGLARAIRDPSLSSISGAITPIDLPADAPARSARHEVDLEGETVNAGDDVASTVGHPVGAHDTPDPSAALLGASPGLPSTSATYDSDQRFATPLTRIGAVVGTPKYMSPEHHRSDDVDALSDQFSFCVSAWEALYGQPPFAGRDRDALARAKERGELVAPPRGAKVPARLRRILTRGLATARADRFPSMEALLAQLARVPGAAQRRAAVGIGAVAIAGLSAFALTRASTDAAARCAEAGAATRALWSEARAAELTAGFARTGRPHAAATARLVTTALDDYAGGLAAMRIGSCEATHVRGEQSEELLDLRTQCLDQRGTELGALVDALVRSPDGDLVDHATDAVAHLEPVDRCGDVAALRAAVPLPTAPEQLARLVTLRQRLAEASALSLTGHYRDAAARAADLTATAHALGYLPLLARTEQLRGDLAEQLNRPDDAAEAFRAAARVAATARDDFGAAQAMTDLAWVTGYRQNHPEVGLGLLDAAEIMIARAGDPPNLRAMLGVRRGTLLGTIGRYDEAVAALRAAVDVRLALGEHVGAGSGAGAALNSLGEVLRDTGRLPEARDCFQRALAIMERTLGPDHPDVSAVLNNLGAVLWSEGKIAQARPYLERSLALDEATFGPDHPRIAVSLLNLGGLENAADHPKEARVFLERALAIQRKALGPDAPELAMAIHNLGAVTAVEGDWPAAQRYFEDALAIFERALGHDHAHAALPLIGIGDTLLARQRPADAAPYYRRAIAILDRAYGPDNADTAYALTGLGRALILLGHPVEALPLLERAVALRTAHEVADDDAARSQFLLARALVDAGRDRARARALAQAARDRIADGPADDRKEIDAWLARHP